MKSVRTLVVAVLSLSLGITMFIADVDAESITRRPCPHSCESEGIPKKKCKDWKEGDLCVVQDLRKRSRDQREKGVTSAPCPYSCDSLGYRKKNCKDWREGDTCFVEVL